jgi:hypothetical protein
VHQLPAPSGAPHKHQPLAPAIFWSSFWSRLFWPPWETAQIKEFQFSAIEGQEIEETGEGAKIGKVVPKHLKCIALAPKQTFQLQTLKLSLLVLRIVPMHLNELSV